MCRGGKVRVRDGNGKRIGGIGAGDARAWQQAFDHRLHLRLVGAANADNGLFHQPRGIFGDREAAACRREQHDTARLAQL